MKSLALKEASAQMDRNIEAIQREFSGVRTGKASPALLENVQVEAYESRMPLNQTATVSAPDPHMLVVQPWDANLVAAVSKAIQSADLGLNPSVDGNLVRVSIPPLTEEWSSCCTNTLKRDGSRSDTPGTRPRPISSST